MAARRITVCAALLAVAALLAGCAKPESSTTEGAVALPAADLDGSPLLLFCTGGERALVLEFVSVDCPIANRALPELTARAAELAPQGVRFVRVYANADETAAAIRGHQADFALTGPAVRDPGGALVRRFGVRVTPEVVALACDGALIYQGRVNDQFTAPGQGRPAPAQHDLADALRDFLRTGQARGVRTPAAGCTVRPAS